MVVADFIKKPEEGYSIVNKYGEGFYLKLLERVVINARPCGYPGYFSIAWESEGKVYNSSVFGLYCLTDTYKLTLELTGTFEYQRPVPLVQE